jgi:hypothetical protein
VDTLRDGDLLGSPRSQEYFHIGMTLEDIRTMMTARGGKAVPQLPLPIYLTNSVSCNRAPLSTDYLVQTSGIWSVSLTPR